MREIARELHVCFFGLQRPLSFLPDTTVWLTAGTVRAVKQTVVSLKLHAMSMCPDTVTTVWMNARTVPAVNQTVVSGRGR